MYLEKLKKFLLKCRELLSVGVYFKVIYYSTMFMGFRAKK